MLYNFNRTVKAVLLAISIIIFANCTVTPAIDTSKPIAYVNKDLLIFEPTDTFTTNKLTQEVILENLGEAELIFLIDDRELEKSDFSYSTNCVGTLTQDDICSFKFQFSPTKVPQQTKVFYIVDTLNDTKLGITLQANGINKTFTSTKILGLSLPSDKIEFPNTTVGDISSPKKYTITTSNSVKLAFELEDNRTIPNKDIKSIYILSSNCIDNGTLASDKSCDINISFSPKKSEAVPANLKIISDTNFETIKLTAIGSQQPEREFATTIKNISTNMKDVKFNAQDIDHQSHTKPIELINKSGLVIDVRYDLTDEYSAFAIDVNNSSCDIKEDIKRVRLSPLQCEIQIIFTPKYAKNYYATLTLTYNNTKHNIAITGRGRPISKGALINGIDNGSATVTYANNTSFAVKIDNIKVDTLTSQTEVFKYRPSPTDCNKKIIEPGRDCTISIEFDIRDQKPHKGEISLLTADSKEIEKLSISVTPVAPSTLEFTP